MKVLVACEESQKVCIAFRKKGHEAYSCDIEPCSGGHPEWHIRADVLPLINGRCKFRTVDGVEHRITGKWDILIVFPPCTDLAGSGARWFEEKRKDGKQRKSIEFFCQFFEADCDKIVIENPVGIISGDYIKRWFPDLCKRYSLPRKPTQIIQPWQFGHGETKKTCLWLKGVPELLPEKIVAGREQKVWRMSPGENRAKNRSKTYIGIANAMANQWG